jgi:hypothetical protein
MVLLRSDAVLNLNSGYRYKATEQRWGAGFRQTYMLCDLKRVILSWMSFRANTTLFLRCTVWQHLPNNFLLFLNLAIKLPRCQQTVHGDGRGPESIWGTPRRAGVRRGMLQSLILGMEHAGEADLGSQVLGSRATSSSVAALV